MLAVDIGNSRIKWALFDAGNIKKYGVFAYSKNEFEKNLSDAGLPETSTPVEVSCVAHSEIKKRFTQWMSVNRYNDCRFAETQAKQCGVTNSYATPTSMGVDRWLAILAAYKEQVAEQSQLTCVIDCGTAITFDVLNDQGMHIGGLIMPGYQTMVRSLVADTGSVEISQSINTALTMGAGLASDTQSAITQGCSQIMLEGLKGIVDSYLGDDSKMRCIVTGGDGEWVYKAFSQQTTGVKNCISEYRPFLVLQGLYFSSL